MHRLTAAVLTGVLAAPAAPQDGAPPENGAFVHASSRAEQLLAAARRATTMEPAVAADVYCTVAAELAELEPGALVPVRGAEDELLLGVHEALHRQLAAEAPAVRAAWRLVAEPRAAVALAAAGHHPAALAAVAQRFPLCEAAVAALVRLGDGHLEAGRLDRARDCYRQARRHLADDLPAPPGLARDAVAAGGPAPAAATDASPGPGLRPAGTAWSTGGGTGAAVVRPPALTDRGVVAADPAGLRHVALVGAGAPAERWRWESPAAALQAATALAIDAAARRWGENDTSGRQRWGPRLPVPRADEEPVPPAPVVAGPWVVALLGQRARAAAALEPVWRYWYGRRFWGRGRGRAVRTDDEWDGTLPDARHLVALPWRDAAPSPAWRVGGAEGAPGLGPASDFASDPLVVGTDVIVAAFAWRHLQAHLLRIDAATGRLRSSTYLGAGAPEHVGGPAGAMLRVPPGMTLGAVHGQVVVVTNVGIVAACDPESGHVRWLRRYPQRGAGGDDEGRPVAAPLALGDSVLVAPWDADHWLAYDAVTGAERARIPRPDGAPAVPLGVRADGAVVARQGPLNGPAQRLVVRAADRRGRDTVAAAPPGTGWVACLVDGGVAWCAGVDAIDRVDLATGAVERVHWFGRDRPVAVAGALGPGGLAVATDRHVHWFRIGP